MTTTQQEVPTPRTDSAIWLQETVRQIDELTVSIEGKAFDPGWFQLWQHLQAGVHAFNQKTAEVEALKQTSPKAWSEMTSLERAAYNSGAAVAEDVLKEENARLKQELERLLSTFRHTHVSNFPEDIDACKQCGLDLRNPIHAREQTPKAGDL